MTDTRRSLLLRAQAGDEAAWKYVAELYRPLIIGWLRRLGGAAPDIEDMAQESFLALVKGLPGFSHNGQRGAFRSWLRTITVNRARDFWKGRHGQTANGADKFLDQMQELEDPNSNLSILWDRQHDQYVLRCLLDLVTLEFEPRTLQAFRRLALEGATGEETARELGMTVPAVYVAKSRVLQRLRLEAAQLID